MNDVIYFDNNATTSVAPEVVEAMLPYLKDKYGNASSIHRFGGGLKKDIDRAREQVAEFLHASPTEIIFTSCGSESDNMAIQGFCQSIGSSARLITSTVEHPAVRNCCRVMAQKGVALNEIGVDRDGLIDKDQLSLCPINHHTLVSFMWANNETGVLFPIDTLTVMVKSNGAFIHTDAVQAVGKVPIDVSAIPVDFLTLSGHKLHAPKGIGALYVRKSASLSPLMYGGHQEKGMRPGTENVAFIVGLAKACELAAKNMEVEQTRVKMMRDKLENNLLAKCKGAKLNGSREFRLPNTTNVSFEYIEGEAILLLLDEKNIAASSGSACTTGSLEPSHVMMAMGVPYTLAHSSIRFSLSVYNTEAEVDRVIEVMPTIVDYLRSLSPFVS